MRAPRLPIRARITAAFAAVMTVLLGAIAVLAYRAMSGALLDEIDTGLRFRAVSLLNGSSTAPAVRPDRRLQEPTEAFEQVLTRTGEVVRTTVGFPRPVLDGDDLAAVAGPKFFQRRVPSVVGTVRILALRDGDSVFVVGASMSDRSDALHELTEVLLLGGPAAVALASLAGWAVAGWALNPVDRMRREAAAITVSDLDRRMAVPRTRDELHRLALTLNDMLARLDRSLSAERSFLEQASHELRTPLAALRAEVDLALGRRRSADELTAALHNVSTETDRLARLADDLLVLARAGDGSLPLRREPVSLRAALDAAVARFAARATGAGVELHVDAPDTVISVDPQRLRQVLVNLLDNALRYTPRGGTVRVSAGVDETATRISVVDSGPGFGTEHTSSGPGLGLRIVAAIARSHGGGMEIVLDPAGGARVEVHLR